VCSLHLPRHFVIAQLRRLPHRAALPHELVPVHLPTLVDTHNSPRLLFCFAAALRSAAEFAPFLHLADEFLLAPLLLAGLGALAAQETCRLAHVRHVTHIILTIGYLQGPSSQEMRRQATGHRF